MAEPVEFDVAFPVHYDLVALDRIERLGGKEVFAFPGAKPVDRQQELAVGPILDVRPEGGDPWIAVFYGAEGYAVPPAARRRRSRERPGGASTHTEPWSLFPTDGRFASSRRGAAYRCGPTTQRKRVRSRAFRSRAGRMGR